METASQTLTPVTLELGGKVKTILSVVERMQDPFVVCDDAPMDFTVDMAFRGAFLNCGQNCLSAERFYVYEKVYDDFVKRVMEHMPFISQGPDSPDNGAINLPSQVCHISVHFSGCS